MKKYFVITICVAALFAAGCQTSAPPDPGTAQQEQPPVDQSPGVQEYTPDPPEILADLIKDEYDGLDFSVNVLERNAILPGMSFIATVVVENTGDETLYYTQGSGSFSTPEALFLFSDSLQTVLPKDHLGIVTMDFVTNELKPGDTLLFKLPVMAVKPNPDFNIFTFELFNEDKYIADMEWPDLQDTYPDLAAAAPGSYTIKAYFLYNIARVENDVSNVFEGPTGYAEAECVISIS